MERVYDTGACSTSYAPGVLLYQVALLPMECGGQAVSAFGQLAGPGGVEPGVQV